MDLSVSSPDQESTASRPFAEALSNESATKQPLPSSKKRTFNFPEEERAKLKRTKEFNRSSFGIAKSLLFQGRLSERSIDVALEIKAIRERMKEIMRELEEDEDGLNDCDEKVIVNSLPSPVFVHKSIGEIGTPVNRNIPMSNPTKLSYRFLAGKHLY